MAQPTLTFPTSLVWPAVRRTPPPPSPLARPWRPSAPQATAFAPTQEAPPRAAGIGHRVMTWIGSQIWAALAITAEEFTWRSSAGDETPGGAGA
jgi:hypothetical protein